MPYGLLPGVREIRRSPSSRPLLIASLVTTIGIGYLVLRKPAAAATPASSNVAVTSIATTPSRILSDHERDDSALHLAHIRSNLQQATEQITRTRRLTDAASRSLDGTSLAVEARRVRAASNAATAAVEALDQSLEEIDVLSNALTKEK